LSKDKDKYKILIERGENGVYTLQTFQMNEELPNAREFITTTLLGSIQYFTQLLQDMR